VNGRTFEQDSDKIKKILVLTRNFPPLIGGMERLNLRMVNELSRHFDVYLIAPQGAGTYVAPSVSVAEIPGKSLFCFLTRSMLTAFHVARQWRPDVVLAGSGLMALAALLTACCTHAQSVSYVHGLDIVVRHPVYRTLWYPALRRLDGIIANSHATAQLAESIGIPAKRIRIIHPGVSLPEPDHAARQRFRTLYSLGDAPILLFVGRLSARKGLREFVSDVLPKIVVRHPDIQLVVIGGVPLNALHAESQTVESIQQAVAQVGLAQHLRFLGKVSDQELADAYAGADVHVFPIRNLPDDQEGFGMVAVEAAAHGLATVAYATGGVVDAVGEGVSGYLASPDDAHAFADLVCRVLEQKLPDDKIRAFAAQFEWQVFGEKIARYLSQFDSNAQTI
jgi:phosphatidylinositol alpha-1,6-mannosyltransferase